MRSEVALEGPIGRRVTLQEPDCAQLGQRLMCHALLYEGKDLALLVLKVLARRRHCPPKEAAGSVELAARAHPGKLAVDFLVFLAAGSITARVGRKVLLGEDQQLLFHLGMTEQQPLHQAGSAPDFLQTAKARESLFNLIEHATEHLVLGA